MDHLLLFMLLVLSFSTPAYSQKCSSGFPFPYDGGKKCCYYKVEKDERTLGSAGMAINDASTSCFEDNFEVCSTASCAPADAPAQGDTACAADTPYAFNKGTKCCKKPICTDGSVLTYSSTVSCCEGSDTAECATPPCYPVKPIGLINCLEKGLDYGGTPAIVPASSTCGLECFNAATCVVWTAAAVGCILSTSAATKTSSPTAISGNKYCTIGEYRECQESHPYVKSGDPSKCCDNKACSNSVACTDGTYCVTRTVSFWSAWGAKCSAECGENGKLTRTRTCYLANQADCPSVEDTKSCNVKVCPINGKWSSWSTWVDFDPVSKCGRGYRYKTRCCDNPAQKFGGDPCPEAPTMVEAHYKYPPCKLDGIFSNWGAWSVCYPKAAPEDCYNTEAEPAETKPTQKALRSCVNPSPHFSGSACVGDTEKEADTCADTKCPIDAKIGADFGDYTPCTRDCFKYRYKCCEAAKYSSTTTCASLVATPDDDLLDTAVACDRGEDDCLPASYVRIDSGKLCLTSGKCTATGECSHCGYGGYCCKKDASDENCNAQMQEVAVASQAECVAIRETVVNIATTSTPGASSGTVGTKLNDQDLSTDFETISGGPAENVEFTFSDAVTNSEVQYIEIYPSETIIQASPYLTVDITMSKLASPGPGSPTTEDCKTGVELDARRVVVACNQGKNLGNKLKITAAATENLYLSEVKIFINRVGVVVGVEIP